MAANYYLKLDGIQGDVTTAGYEKTLELLAWSWALSRPNPATAERIIPRPSFQDLTFTINGSAASPLLFMACAEGKPIASGELFVTRTDQGKYETSMSIVLKDIVVTGFKDSATPGLDRPAQEISIGYGAVEVTYFTKGAPSAGPVKRGWNVKENQPI
jgi:type VI secretion system secreted protein Hcp